MSDNAGTNVYCTDPNCPYQPQEHVHGPGYVRAEPEPTPAPAAPVPDARDEEIARLAAERDAAIAALTEPEEPDAPGPTPAPTA